MKWLHIEAEFEGNGKGIDSKLRVFSASQLLGYYIFLIEKKWVFRQSKWLNLISITTLLWPLIFICLVTVDWISFFCKCIMRLVNNQLLPATFDTPKIYFSPKDNGMGYYSSRSPIRHSLNFRNDIYISNWPVNSIQVRVRIAPTQNA